MIMLLLYALFLSASSTLAFQHDAWRVGVKPFAKARIDYRLVNQYVAQTYDSSQTRQPYFTASQAKQSVWNGRNGVYDDSVKLWKPASLDYCGFALQPTTNAQSLQELKKAVEASFSKESSISDVCFWYPIEKEENELVVEEEAISDLFRPTAKVAGILRVDKDMDLKECANVQDFILEGNKQLVSGDGSVVNQENLADKLQKGHRFAIVNVALPSAKKNIAVMATCYQTATSSFPTAVPNARSRWYCFPKLTDKEVLLFYQYDRLLERPSNVWNCVLEKETRTTIEPRNTFDLKCLVVFDEKVSHAQDRFGDEHRMRQAREEWQ